MPIMASITSLRRSSGHIVQGPYYIVGSRGGGEQVLVFLGVAVSASNETRPYLPLFLC